MRSRKGKSKVGSERDDERRRTGVICYLRAQSQTSIWSETGNSQGREERRHYKRNDRTPQEEGTNECFECHRTLERLRALQGFLRRIPMIVRLHLWKCKATVPASARSKGPSLLAPVIGRETTEHRNDAAIQENSATWCTLPIPKCDVVSNPRIHRTTHEQASMTGIEDIAKVAVI